MGADCQTQQSKCSEWPARTSRGSFISSIETGLVIASLDSCHLSNTIVIQLLSPKTRRLHSYMASRLRARVARRSPSPLGSITAASSPGFEEKFPAPFTALPAPGRARLLLNPAISRVAFFLGERVF